jgi:hypothetical protein
MYVFEPWACFSCVTETVDLWDMRPITGLEASKLLKNFECLDIQVKQYSKNTALWLFLSEIGMIFFFYMC